MSVRSGLVSDICPFIPFKVVPYRVRYHRKKEEWVSLMDGSIKQTNTSSIFHFLSCDVR